MATAPGRRLFGSLRSRVVVFFVALLVLVQGVSVVLVYVANNRIARAKVAEELILGERIFRRLLEQNSRQLAQAAGILALDFAFRDAAATRDVETIRSALVNHGARIGADLMALVALEGEVIVDTLGVAPRQATSPYVALVEAARREGRAGGILVAGPRRYQAAAVPVLAPEPIAWAVFGFVVDDRLARELKNLSGLDVSFLARDAAGAWRLLASTVPAEQQEALRDTLPAADPIQAGQRETLIIGGEEFGSRLIALQETQGAAMVAVLQRSLEEVLRPFKQLEQILIALALASVVAASLGGAIIAASVTRPVSMLAEMTRHIEDGDYTHAVTIRSPDEVGELARRFDEMRAGIARREEQILHLAYRDVLTDLPNRTLFNDRLRVAVEAARRAVAPLVVMVMDLDRFKHVNDTLGHAAGDQLLQQVAQRLQGVLRKSDTVARLGGDEFAVMLPGTGLEDARGVAHKIEQALQEPIVIEQHAIDISASIGAAMFPADGEDAEELLRHADSAMYAAKRARSGFTAYDPKLQVERQEQLSLLSELRRAVDNGELRLVYQPKVELASGAVSGAEALVRWDHPERGLVAPAQFIPFAEQTGFIRTITRWVLEAAARQAAAWSAAGRPLKISLNISVQDLLDVELPAIVSETLQRHALPAELLTLEVTESDVMRDAPRAINVLRRLTQIGVGRAIDDFGTGYSSLAYMKQLSVDEVKIDRSFVRHITEDWKDEAIVLSTIELAHNLGLTVTAEGVEDEASLALLKRLGCDQAQGYLFAKPLEAGAFADWAAQHDAPGARTSRASG